MFRANPHSREQGWFDSSQWMSPRIRRKLEKSWAPRFYQHVFCKVDEKPFAELYADTGRPNFPVNILLCLEYIKHMKGCNDEELLNDFYFNYLVNHAVGLRVLGQLHLAERTFYYFRKRVYQYSLDHPGQDDLMFGQFIGLTQHFAGESGLSWEEQRTDTTQFMSNIKKAGRLGLAYDVLVKAIKALPSAELPRALQEVLQPTFKTEVLYRSTGHDKDAKLTRLLQLCQAALQQLEARPELAKGEAARILKRFLSEQSVPVAADDDGDGDAGETGQPKPAADLPAGLPPVPVPAASLLAPKPAAAIPSGSLQSAHDEDATYRSKGKSGQSGYQLELSETCGRDNDVQFITDYTVTPNNVSDITSFTERLPVIAANTGCTDMYVDGGFHSPETVQPVAQAHGITLHLTNLTGRETIQKLPLTAFAMDASTQLIQACPGGQAPLRAWVSPAQTCAHFAHAVCADCTLRERCYSRPQAQAQVVRLRLQSVQTSRIRATMQANRATNVSQRAGIEGSISALKRTGLAKLAVRGRAKVNVVCGLKVTAQNIKRFIKYLQGGYPPKVRNALLTG